MERIWEKMKLILNGFRKGTLYNIHMLENGLIYAGERESADLDGCGC